MLREKDRQIEELTSLLRQKQRLVELLRMQLEHRKSGGRGPEALVLVRVKQEPPDKPSEPPSLHPSEPRRASSISSEIDACNATVKPKAIEADEAAPETTMQFPDACVVQQTSTQLRELQIKAGQTNTRAKQQNVCLQETTLQFAQQQAIQKLLLQQQKNMQKQQQTTESQGQTLENQQKLSRPKKKKSQKQQLRQQQQPERLTQQSPLLQQQTKQQQTKQVQQIQTKAQKQVLIQQKQQAQQQSPQVRSWFYTNTCS